MSVYKEIPPHLLHGFHRYPSKVPDTYTRANSRGFMPRPDVAPNLDEVQAWCQGQFGRDGFFRKSVYFFLPETNAFAFKMRWC